jgi:hypothetical protein
MVRRSELIDEQESSKPESSKRVKVLRPFRVVHDGIPYGPDAIAEVPESVAAQWILNRWVDDASD